MYHKAGSVFFESKKVLDIKETCYFFINIIFFLFPLLFFTMPYIYTQQFYYINSAYKLNEIIQQYQHIIKQDPVARCMIGFVAAQLIRDPTFSLPVESIEDWLKSREPIKDTDNVTSENNSDLNTLMDILKGICYESPSEEPCENEMNTDKTTAYHEPSAQTTNKLCRYTSRSPYDFRISQE